MAAKNYIKVALVTLLTLALVICMVPMAFATETADETDGAVDAEIVIATNENTADDAAAEDTVVSEESIADTIADTAEDTVASTEVAGEESTDDTAADTEADTAADTAEVSDETGSGTTEEKGGISTGTIVSIVIVAVIVIAAAVYCIKNREKVAKFFREVKSECKKIAWTPWKTVRKNTFVVVIIVIVCAIVIGALDLLFSKGIISLGDLF